MYLQNKPWAGSENVQVHEWSIREEEGKEKEVVTAAKLLKEILHFWHSTKYSCLSFIITTTEEEEKEFVHGWEGKVQPSGRVSCVGFSRPCEIIFLFKQACNFSHKK